MSSEATQAKKQKVLTDEASSVIEVAEKSEPTCNHWVVRKKRFCKMTVSKGKKYCGEHEPATKTSLDQETNEQDRIPCPLDGKHTVYKKNLRKHLKICNARQRDDQPEYFIKGINAGDPQDEDVDYSKLKLTELDDDEFYGIIEKMKELYSKYVEGQITTIQTQHKLLDEELANPSYGNETRKHLVQISSILGILEEENKLLNDTSYVEYGAGKGQLAYYLAKLLEKKENSQVVILDFMSLRHKKDNKIEDRSLVHRIRVDIADFHMNRFELLKKTRHNVAVSKHLCGGATDLALRCITQPSTDETSSTNFIFIALCCHHRCTWRSFVGKEFFLSHSITPRQFAIITKMSSWTICGTGMSRERRRALKEQALLPTQSENQDIHKIQRLSLEEREQIGFMSKRLLDHARLEFLRQNGYEAELKYYVPRDVTLENVCLLARRHKAIKS